jgi:hypothetical protein
MAFEIKENLAKFDALASQLPVRKGWHSHLLLDYLPGRDIIASCPKLGG